MLKEDKDALRAEYKARRREIPPEIKAGMDQAITRRVMGLISYRYAGTVLLYWPKSAEIDTLPLAEAALAAGKRIGFPVTLEGGRMEFRLTDSLEAGMMPGRFGIPEPGPDCPTFSPGDRGAALLIVPGLAFDAQGYRLGYGKGYYDRFMEVCPLPTVGLCYLDFLAKSLPRGRYDRAVDLIVTEKGVRMVAQKERT